MSITLYKLYINKSPCSIFSSYISPGLQNCLSTCGCSQTSSPYRIYDTHTTYMSRGHINSVSFPICDLGKWMTENLVAHIRHSDLLSGSQTCCEFYFFSILNRWRNYMLLSKFTPTWIFLLSLVWPFGLQVCLFQSFYIVTYLFFL